MSITKIKTALYNLEIPTSFIHVVVSIIFFFVWVHISMEFLAALPTVLFLLLGIGLPLVLLVGILQYKSNLAYLIVNSIFVFQVFTTIRPLYYHYKALFTENQYLLLSNSYCPLCEIQDLLVLNIIALLAISFMHCKRMVKQYNWDTNAFYKSVTLAVLLLVVVFLFN